MNNKFGGCEKSTGFHANKKKLKQEHPNLLEVNVNAPNINWRAMSIIELIQTELFEMLKLFEGADPK